jgi:DNA phosphorothioation-associated putative methyltransferase
VLTGRGTFQKFHEQSELKTYLESQLEAEAIPAGIGIFYLFKDEGRRQQFLANRFRRREILPRRRIADLRLEETRQALEPLMEVVVSGIGIAVEARPTPETSLSSPSFPC